MTEENRLLDKNKKPVRLIAVDKEGNETIQKPTTGVKKIKLHEKMSAEAIRAAIEGVQKGLPPAKTDPLAED